MADLPPISPTPPTPPVPPVPPIPPLGQGSASVPDSEGEDLSSLSPMAVLRKKGAAPLAVPSAGVIPPAAAPAPSTTPSVTPAVAPSTPISLPGSKPQPPLPGQTAASVPTSPVSSQKPSVPLPSASPISPVAPPVTKTPSPSPVVVPTVPSSPSAPTSPLPLPSQPATTPSVSSPTLTPPVNKPGVPPLSTSAPAGSVSNSPLDVDVDRDELLKQAAVSPNAPFVLPSLPKPGESTPPPAPVPTAPKLPLPPTPAAPAPSTVPVTPAPALAKPLPSTGVLRPAVVQTPPQGVTPPRANLTVPKQHGSSLWVSILGGIIALVILGGGVYALADSGVRVPWVYTKLSGLQPKAPAAAQAGSTAVLAQKSYMYTGQEHLQLEAGGSSSSDLSNSSSPVYQLDATVTNGQFSSGDTSDIVEMSVAANGKNSVPLVLRSTGSTHLAYFPAGTSKDTSLVESDQIGQTLIYPVLNPIPASTLLKAVKTETAYEKKVVNSRAVAAYSVTFDCSVLQATLPKGMTLSGCGGTIALNWVTKDTLGNLPTEIYVTSILNYQSKNYTWTSLYDYTDWGIALGSNKNQGDLVLIANQDPTAISSSPLSAQEVVSNLGINFAQLPHATALDTQQTGTTVITPSGLSTTSPTGLVASNPPVPTQPADAAALSRDTQRKKDLLDLKKALDAYKAKTGAYPISALGGEQAASSQALFTALVPTYITGIPLDPLKGTYYYYYQSNGSTYTLRAVLENASDPDGKQGSTYTFYELTNS